MIDVLNVSFQTQPYVEPLAAEQLVQVLADAGLDARLISTSLSGSMTDEDLEGRLDSQGVIFAGLNSVRDILDQNSVERNRVASKLREIGFEGFIVALGHQVTIDAEATLEACPSLDAIILGDADLAGRHLAHLIETGNAIAGVQRPAAREVAEEVDRTDRWLRQGLPATLASRPYLDALLETHPASRLAAVIETSRGCFHAQCTFCSTPVFRGASHEPMAVTRPVPLVVDEIRALVADRGLRRFIFEDDFFAAPTSAGIERLEELSDAILRLDTPIEFSMVLRSDALNDQSVDVFRGLRSAGLRLIYLGVESFSDSDLAFYNKGITLEQTLTGIDTAQKLGYAMDVAAPSRLKPGLLPFHPYTMLEDIATQSSYLHRYAITPIKMLAEVELYPGTPLHAAARADGLLQPGTRSGFRYKDARAQQFQSVARDALRTIYRPRKAIRNIEKTAAGFERDPKCVEPIKKIRKGLEAAFEAFYLDSLAACIGGCSQKPLDTMLGTMKTQVDGVLASSDAADQVEATWALVRDDVLTEYGIAPSHVEPVFFRPCWFPVVH